MDDLINALKLPSPIQSFYFEEFPVRKILIKRDDLIHPQVSGNKWRKLKYNIKHAHQQGLEGIISFGGAFSNHLYAVAGACSLTKLKFIAYVRGDEFDGDNPTLQFLKSQGAELKFQNRSAYRNKTDEDFLLDLRQKYPNYLIVPEGGSNDLAITGVTELMNEVYSQLDSDKLLVFCGVGSGSTITGITKGLKGQDKAFGLLAVNDTSLPAKISESLSDTEQSKLQLDLHSHLGGFGKTSPDLINFINRFYTNTGVPLEPLYTGKVAYRILEMLKENLIDASQTILMIHTGGLQGNFGFDYRFPGKLIEGLVKK